MSTTLLAIDSSTSACSAALQLGDQISQRYEVGSNIHSQQLLGMVRDLLTDAEIEVTQLDAVAVGQGPGSFTGLRIGIGVAQGLAYGANCQMIGISSLAALALQSELDGVVMAGVDARMREIYWGCYRKLGNTLEALGTNQVGRPQEVPIEQADVLIGNAWLEYLAEFDDKEFQGRRHLSDILYPRATEVLTLAESAYRRGELVSPIEFAPQYVRNDVAKKSTKDILRKG